MSLCLFVWVLWEAVSKKAASLFFENIFTISTQIKKAAICRFYQSSFFFFFLLFCHCLKNCDQATGLRIGIGCPCPM